MVTEEIEDSAAEVRKSNDWLIKPKVHGSPYRLRLLERHQERFGVLLMVVQAGAAMSKCLSVLSTARVPP